MRVVIYKDKAHEWRWHIFANNGRMIANAGEGYKGKAGAIKGLRALANITTAHVTVCEQDKAAVRITL